MNKTLSFNRPIRALVVVLCIAALLCAFVPSSAHAEWQSGQPVKVGFFAMDGYHVKDESGALSGYGYEFICLLAQYSNMRFQYVGYDKSWDEMQQMLLDGEIDLLTSAQKTDERDELFAFSSNLIGTSAAILSVRAGDERFSGGDYSGMRIGLVKNSSRNQELADYMAQHGFSYTPVYYDSMAELTAALQRGEDIDAVMTSNLRLPENEWVLETLSSSPFYAIVREEDQALLSQVDDAIARMDVNSAGWRTRLFNKYYSVNSGDAVTFSEEERVYLEALAGSGRVLTVTMNPDCAPYSYFENGQAKGVIPAIFDEVASRMGIAYEMIEPADRAEYQRLCIDGAVDIILDGLNDLYTTEINGLEISASYYSTPLAALTELPSVGEIKSLAQPRVTLLNESCFSDVFAGIPEVKWEFDTYGAAADYVKKGSADAAIMPYYCAQWLCSADETGRLNCLMIPSYERAFVYAVGAGEDYQLLSSLNKALDSLSEDAIASIVADNTQYPGSKLSLAGFVYQNPVPSILIALLFFAIVAALVYVIYSNRLAYANLLRSRRLERYIGYLCDMYDRVLEVDFDLHTRRQYIKNDKGVSIAERDDFTSFAIESIYPDDVDSSLAVFSANAVRELFDSGRDEQYVESRMLSDSGEYRWYSFLLKLIPRDEEHPCSAMLLIKDIDELHRERESSHEALVNALEAANAASNSKSTFLSSMSHEIRTPLNAMIGYMTIASASIDNKEKVIHCIESAGLSARHLLSIINDILDISSMESGKMKIASERFDLKEQINGVAAMFYQQCKLKKISFVISIDGLTEEWVIGDAMRVNQILLNLMSNAVKFTEDGGVTLTVTQTRCTASQVFIRFVVADTGIGMAPEYLGRLFAPFEQESSQTARKYGGTGLGMPITLNLVKLMGGTIDVDSKQGTGSTFSVTLPFGRTENPSLKLASSDFSDLRVLVVDDLENECEYIRALLDRCGIYSACVQSGEEAIALVAKYKDSPQRFDLCIIDWNMPSLNGVQTTKLIHQECDPDIPIIIATAYDIAEFEHEALSAGAVKIISKPIFQSTLLDLLVNTYGKYEPKPDDNDPVPDLAGMHVLLAEDNETNAEVALDLLDIAGVTADVARNGREAVELFHTKGDSYDLILMDVQMPVMDGYAATRLIRSSGDPRAATIPILALTADAFAENVAAALSAGMDDHISKPIETELLFAVLKKYYRRRG